MAAAPCSVHRPPCSIASNSLRQSGKQLPVYENGTGAGAVIRKVQRSRRHRWPRPPVPKCPVPIPGLSAPLHDAPAPYPEEGALVATVTNTTIAFTVYLVQATAKCVAGKARWVTEKETPQWTGDKRIDTYAAMFEWPGIPYEFHV